MTNSACSTACAAHAAWVISASSCQLHAAGSTGSTGCPRCAVNGGGVRVECSPGRRCRFSAGVPSVNERAATSSICARERRGPCGHQDWPPLPLASAALMGPEHTSGGHCQAQRGLLRLQPTLLSCQSVRSAAPAADPSLPACSAGRSLQSPWCPGYPPVANPATKVSPLIDRWPVRLDMGGRSRTRCHRGAARTRAARSQARAGGQAAQPGQAKLQAKRSRDRPICAHACVAESHRRTCTCHLYLRTRRHSRAYSARVGYVTTVSAKLREARRAQRSVRRRTIIMNGASRPERLAARHDRPPAAATSELPGWLAAWRCRASAVHCIALHWLRALALALTLFSETED